MKGSPAAARGQASDRAALAILLAGAVGIAFAPIFVRVSELPPTATAFYRFAFASVSLLVQPVAAALLAWLLLGEAVGPAQGVGAAVVLAGIWVARHGSRGT